MLLRERHRERECVRMFECVKKKSREMEREIEGEGQREKRGRERTGKVKE